MVAIWRCLDTDSGEANAFARKKKCFWVKAPIGLIVIGDVEAANQRSAVSP